MSFFRYSQQAPEIAELLWRLSRHADRETTARFVSSLAVALAEQLQEQEQRGDNAGGDGAFTREQLARIFVKVRINSRVRRRPGNERGAGGGRILRSSRLVRVCVIVERRTKSHDTRQFIDTCLPITLVRNMN